MFNFFMHNNNSTLELSDFLKIGSHANGFKNYKNLTVSVNADNTASHIEKLIQLLKSATLPSSLILKISKRWYDDQIYKLFEIFDASSQAKCTTGLEIHLFGIARSNEVFESVKRAVTSNPCIINVEFLEGDGCKYLDDSIVENNIHAIKQHCIKNKYILNYPNLKNMIIDSFNSPEKNLQYNLGLLGNQDMIQNILEKFKTDLSQRSKVNFTIEK